MCDPQALRWALALWGLVLRPAALSPLRPPAASAASEGSLPSPRNVHFVSRNMKNVLHWLPPEGLAEDELSYSVKYLIYGTNKWIKNSACTNISRTWCDLSVETHDHKELYHASVKAFSNGTCSSWAESLRFNPLTDSQIDPPAFAISSTERSISVVVAPLERWKGDPREKPEHLHQIYPDLQYNVSVFNKATRKKWLFSTKKNRLDVFQLEPNTVYCVTVEIYITPFLLSGYSKENCVATLKDPTFKQTTILLEYILPALLIGLFILVSSCCVYRYIHITGQKYPKNLVLKNSNAYQGDVFVPLEKTVVNVISVNVVDQCKTLQDTHFPGNAESPAGDCAGCDAVKEPSKVQEQHSPEICPNEEAVLENEQGGNGPGMTRLRTHDTRGQRPSEDALVYEFDVRGEYAVPTEEEQGERCLKEKMGVLEGRLHHSPKDLTGLATEGTEQSYCPQYDINPPDALSVHKLRELLSDELGLAPVNLQVPLINLGIDDQGFCPESGVVADICLAPDQKEPFWDEKRVKLRETQTLAFPVMIDASSSSSSSSSSAWNGQGQEGAEGGPKQSTVVDWDPQTGAPFLPALANLTNKEVTEDEKQEELQEGGVLSRPCSDDLSEGEEEAYLLQLKEQWELEIQMQT